MAYTYTDITNEVLSRMNEVTLTNSGFESARGFQIQCKNAVNDAINYIDTAAFNWPFNHVTATEVLVAGQTRYNAPPNTKTIDYDTFRLVGDSDLGVEGHKLAILAYKEYVAKCIWQEDTGSAGGIPKRIVRTPDDNFLLYPFPDKEYTIKFEHYSKPVPLLHADDVPYIPEIHRQVIADGATAYAYQFRGEMDQYQANWARFETGITDMRTLLSNRYPYVRSTVVKY